MLLDDEVTPMRFAEEAKGFMRWMWDRASELQCASSYGVKGLWVGRHAVGGGEVPGYVRNWATAEKLTVSERDVQGISWTAIHFAQTYEPIH